jgi:hypothetical protein
MRIVRRNEMKPGFTNRICAHPAIICCVIGASALNGSVLTVLSHGVRLAEIASGWQGTLLLGQIVFATTLLGCLLGAVISWPVFALCRRVNGAPLKSGDRVLILSGPHRGTATEVYEITTGQGGCALVRVDLGPSYKDDIFEEYAVLKLKGEPDGAARGSQLIRSRTNSTSPAPGSPR